jgi:phospholipase C
MPPLGDLSGNYIGAAMCEENYPSNQPPIPYGAENANADPSLLVEDGFKAVRGALTEGRYLTFEMNSFALTRGSQNSDSLSATKATAGHESKAQRWVIHQVNSNDYTQNTDEFMISSAVNGEYLSQSLKLGGNTTNDAGIFFIDDMRNGKGYSIYTGNGKYLGISSKGTITHSSQEKGFAIFSVTYKS